MLECWGRLKEGRGGPRIWMGRLRCVGDAFAGVRGRWSLECASLPVGAPWLLAEDVVG